MKKLLTATLLFLSINCFAQADVYEEKSPTTGETGRTIVFTGSMADIEIQSNQMYLSCNTYKLKDTIYFKYSSCDMGRGGMQFKGTLPKQNTVIAKACIVSNSLHLYYTDKVLATQLSKFIKAALPTKYIAVTY